ncbi:MAG: molybdopterin converting factor, subunit 1 [Planctomycetes bacterium]|nr:molybdopterin converting factor, subunit 1 [Planctomycetota bacterium]
MLVTIKVFGPEAQAVGAAEVRVDVADPVTPGRLRAAIAERFPQLASHLAHARFAVNHEFADDDKTIGEDDEVAWIGQVSGG